MAENEQTWRTAVLAFEGLLYVARSISSENASVRLEVLTFDLTTGAPGPTFDHPNMVGRLVEHEGALHLMTGLLDDQNVALGLYELVYSITHAPGPQNRWALGVTTHKVDGFASDLKVREMEGTEPLGSWRRVSALDFSHTENARLNYQGERLIATWADVYVRYVRERKLRCIAE